MFKRVLIVNFLLFVSVFALFPVLPVAMAHQLDVTIADAGYIFLWMILGRILAAPFVNYLIDAFKRKYVCITTLAIILIATAIYLVTDKKVEAYLVAFIQGVSLGIITPSLITLSIDVTPSEHRNKANVIFGWLTRFGMVIGIGLGGFLYLNTGFLITIYASLAIGVLAVFFLISVHIPFRAPIGFPLLSLDRFLLPRGWVVMINMIMISFVAGIFIPLVHYKVESLLTINGFILPYSIVIIAGYFITRFLKKDIKKRSDRMLILSALFALLLSVSFFMISDHAAVIAFSGILLGASFGLITPLFLMIFVELSSHCERASANTTNLLSWGTGLSLGLCVSCYLKDNYISLLAYQSALLSASFSLLYFIFFTYPYYLKKKVR